MNDPCAASPLVEVVHILGDHGDIVVFLKAGDRVMGGVGLRLGKQLTELVIKPEHKFPVPVPSLNGRDLHRIIFPPKAT